MDLTPYMGVPEWTKNVDPHAHGYPSYMERAFERPQLDACILLCDQTVDFLYSEYTPKTTLYVPGTRPLLEEVVEHVCAGCETELDRARALVQWRRANYRHLGKCGLGTEEEIILGGYSMCHDASRCLITLCQVAGLGARMIIGLNNDKHAGHTLTEVCADGKWMVLDPSPTMPHAWYLTPEGTYASARDIQLDPTIPQRCERHFKSSLTPTQMAEFFTHCRLVNHSLEDSTRFMARRFVRMVAAAKVIENYDYLGHMNHTPVSGYVDLDGLVSQWLDGTVPAERPATV